MGEFTDCKSEDGSDGEPRADVQRILTAFKAEAATTGDVAELERIYGVQPEELIRLGTRRAYEYEATTAATITQRVTTHDEQQVERIDCQLGSEGEMSSHYLTGITGSCCGILETSNAYDEEAT